MQAKDRITDSRERNQRIYRRRVLEVASRQLKDAKAKAR